MRVMHDALCALVSGDAGMMRCLHAVRGLALPDAWIGAGFVRNKVWDALHRTAGASLMSDVDVVYFDPSHLDEALEKTLEKQLRGIVPRTDWSVKNQARMHIVNGDPVYRNTEDALRYWPETCTAIAIRLEASGELEMLAPFGLEDVFGLCVRPTPWFADKKMHVFRERQRLKQWRTRWPMLTLSGLQP